MANRDNPLKCLQWLPKVQTILKIAARCETTFVYKCFEAAPGRASAAWIQQVICRYLSRT